MEELALTDPVVNPSTTTAKFRVIAVVLDLESGAPEPGQVLITLRDNLDKIYFHKYEGAVAVTMIKSLNTANLSTKSLHKRILERLAADGVLPGTVVGTPDPPTADDATEGDDVSAESADAL